MPGAEPRPWRAPRGCRRRASRLVGGHTAGCRRTDFGGLRPGKALPAYSGWQEARVQPEEAERDDSKADRWPRRPVGSGSASAYPGFAGWAPPAREAADDSAAPRASAAGVHVASGRRESRRSHPQLRRHRNIAAPTTAPLRAALGPVSEGQPSCRCSWLSAHDDARRARPPHCETATRTRRYCRCVERPFHREDLVVATDPALNHPGAQGRKVGTAQDISGAALAQEPGFAGRAGCAARASRSPESGRPLTGLPPAGATPVAEPQ